MLTLFCFLWLLDHASSVNVYAPVVRSNMMFKDGNVDISIQRVDELHVHQEQREANWRPGKLEDIPHGTAAFVPLIPAGNISWKRGNESKPDNYEGAEVPVPDMHDGRDMFDSTVSLTLVDSGHVYTVTLDVWGWVFKGYEIIARKLLDYVVSHTMFFRLLAQQSNEL